MRSPSRLALGLCAIVFFSQIVHFAHFNALMEDLIGHQSDSQAVQWNEAVRDSASEPSVCRVNGGEVDRTNAAFKSPSNTDIKVSVGSSGGGGSGVKLVNNDLSGGDKVSNGKDAAHKSSSSKDHHHKSSSHHSSSGSSSREKDRPAGSSGSSSHSKHHSSSSDKSKSSSSSDLKPRPSSSSPAITTSSTSTPKSSSSSTPKPLTGSTSSSQISKPGGGSSSTPGSSSSHHSSSKPSGSSISSRDNQSSKSHHKHSSSSISKQEVKTDGSGQALKQASDSSQAAKPSGSTTAVTNSSSSKDKERDRQKDKDRHSKSDTDKHRSSSSSERSKTNVPALGTGGSSGTGSGTGGSSGTVLKCDVTDSDKLLLSIKAERASPVKHVTTTTTTKSIDDDDDEKPLLSRLSQITKQQTKTTQSPSPTKVKTEKREESDDDLPLTERINVDVKRKRRDSGDSDTPLSVRVNKKTKVESEQKKKRKHDIDEDFDIKDKKPKATVKKEVAATETPKKGRKKTNEQEETSWKWWEEEKKDEGVKWKTLEHKGPVFAPAYEPLPSNIKFYYDGKVMSLSPEAEEVAGFYARMLEHDYTTRELFNSNYFKDWRKVMTKHEREVLTDLRKCNFKELAEYFKLKSEERKNMSKEQKQVIKKDNEEMLKEFGFCIIDGHKQKIGNFKIEPPGLFRGRGDHPKQGMLKRRVEAEDVIINCSKGSKVPPPPPGHKWKEVRHDNTVTWLASWTENVQGQNKYIMLNAASKLKGEKDWMKYETARKLHKRIDKIRENYREDWKSKEMRIRQRAVALYFIDKLALRAGNEKDEDQADTVGCCSLRVEHIKLHEEYEGRPFVVEFDFLGKDSIRYYNRVEVEKRVFKNLQLFVDNKQDGDDLFDRLNTTILNKHLQSLMDGLTAKVFRTYNASHTLQQQLNLLANEQNFADEGVPAKLLAYNRANRAVAILCNHQRAVSKNFGKQMENLQAKIDAKKDQVHAAKKDLKDAKADLKASKTETNKNNVAKKKKAVDRLKEQLMKLELQATDKDENKEIALSTSKLNYLDPRISIAWCKKWDVPIEKVYNKTQRDKFAWAIDMADEDYEF